MSKKIGAVIIGGTGFGAAEVLRFLSRHPEAEVAAVVSSSSSGAPVAKSHSYLQGVCDLTFVDQFKPELLSDFENKIVFSALPHGVSAEALSAMVPFCLENGIKVVDLSGDFRLKDAKLHKHFYCTSERSEEVASKAVYGIPEINREQIKEASFVANPGCNASACIFSLLPVVQTTVTSPIVFDVKTGVSGAGRTANETTHFAFRNADAKPYKILDHRHEPEVMQAVKFKDQKSMFVPHLIPTNRGILVSTYFTCSKAGELQAKFEERYKNEPFIRVRHGGVSLRDVIGSNYCDVSVSVRDDQVVVHAALDNMVKGMAGAAVQNMNLMCGLEETAGIDSVPLGLL